MPGVLMPGVIQAHVRCTVVPYKREPGNFTVTDLQVVPLDARGQPVQREPPRGDLNLDDTASREYVPLRIVDERYRGQRKQYLVRWKGYPASEATWTPARELLGTRALAVWDAN
jgi:hypothetical protein